MEIRKDTEGSDKEGSRIERLKVLYEGRPEEIGSPTQQERRVRGDGNNAKISKQYGKTRQR